MADDFLSGMEKFFFGDHEKKQELQDQISGLQRKFESAMDPTERNALEAQIQGLTAKMNQQLQTNGVMDANGKFTNPYDIQDKYIDKSYLQGLKNQATQTRDLTLANALKASQQNQKRGFNTGLADVVGATENAQRGMNEQLDQATKQEKELAYNKAVSDITNKFNMTKSLTDEERTNLNTVLQSKFNEALMQGNMTMAEYNVLMGQLNSLPEGALVQMAQSIMTSAGGEIGSFLGNPLKQSPVTGMLTGSSSSQTGPDSSEALSAVSSIA